MPAPNSSFASPGPGESVFDVVPDPIARAALDEMTAPGDYKYVMLAPNAQAEFPPEPATYDVVTAAYLRPGAPGGIKREFAVLSREMPSEEAVLGLYGDTIATRQANMGILLEAGQIAGVRELSTVDGMRGFCIDAVRGVGRHLLAAHVVARVVRDGSLIDALVVPSKVLEGLTFLLRDAIAPLAAQMPAGDPVVTRLRPFLQANPNMREPGSVAAAGLLPDITVIQRCLQQTAAMRRQY